MKNCSKEVVINFYDSISSNQKGAGIKVMLAFPSKGHGEPVESLVFGERKVLALRKIESTHVSRMLLVYLIRLYASYNLVSRETSKPYLL